MTIQAAETMVAANPWASAGFANAAPNVIDDGVRRSPGLQPGMSGDAYRACLEAQDEARKETVASAPARRAKAKDMLDTAGYVYSRDNQRWERPGYWAQATGYDWSEMTVYVYRDGTPVAMSATEGHPAESLSLGR